MFKFIHRYLRGRWERYYLKSHWHLVLDLSLLLVIVILAGTVVGLYFYHPNFSGIQYTPPTVDLNNPPLELNYSLASSSLRIKEAAVLKIDFKNNGTVAIDNININLTTTDTNFTVSRLEASDQSALKINGREIVLTRIEAGASGEAVLKIYFNQKNLQARSINWQAQSQYIFAGQLLKATINLPVLIIPAELEVKGVVYYTSPQGDQLGIGPLPPIATVPTNYWIFWEANSAHDFKNLVFSARLPKGVELYGGRSLLSGEFNYSTSSRQVIWKIPSLKGGGSSYRLGFEIQLIPTLEQVGKVLPLLTGGRYYGRDALTGAESSGSLQPLSTNLEGDHFNAGQGEVVKP